MVGWLLRRMDGRVDLLMGRWDVKRDGQLDGWMDGYVVSWGGWMDGRLVVLLMVMMHSSGYSTHC